MLAINSPCENLKYILREQMIAWVEHKTDRLYTLRIAEKTHRQFCPICGGQAPEPPALYRQLWPGAKITEEST